MFKAIADNREKNSAAYLYGGGLMAIVFFVSNNRILLCWVNNSCRYVNALADYITWGLIALTTLLLLVRFDKVPEYFMSWKRNWGLLIFVFYSIASIFWSIIPERSAHTVYIMIAASVSGAVFATVYSPTSIVKALLGFTMVCAVLSLGAIVFFPAIGIHQDAVWQGSWRGIFDHKNDFGPLMALGNCLALLGMFAAEKRSEKIALSLFFILGLFLAIMSRCTTAVILLVILNGLIVLYFGWLRWGLMFQRGRLVRYAAVLVVSVFLGVLIIGLVLRATGKNLQLTGRIPLWLNLIENVVSKKPWFGYGLETVWYIPDFQKWAAVSSGWGERIIVINGHNGYMDILIYLGICGLALLCLFLTLGIIRAVRRAINGRSWLAFFPLLMLVYFLIANITIDYILEFERFHWILLMIILFLPPGTFQDGPQSSKPSATS